MPPGDGIRRNIAKLSQTERDQSIAALIKLDKTKYPDNVSYWDKQDQIHQATIAQAIRSGAVSCDFFGTAYGQIGDSFDGFQFGGGSVQLDDTLLLIEPDAAKQYEARQSERLRKAPDIPTGFHEDAGTPPTQIDTREFGGSDKGKGSDVGRRLLPRSFHGTMEVAPASAKMRMVQIADEIISFLGSDLNASVKVVVEISAEFPDGAKDGQPLRSTGKSGNTFGNLTPVKPGMNAPVIRRGIEGRQPSEPMDTGPTFLAEPAPETK